ncbi:hypothetical protein Pmani_004017 [Petrolisthes manimaculis]|uniref:Uncharacterized protein n=1 Tax=Petrolisthes manimaculis TaxID=1843537 RepID=A0AAE1QHQ4_9EUCA|nr:hypothetical protein Pmani_004017 [Petrolisthes manimaculis]
MSRAIDVAVSRTRSQDMATSRTVAGQLFNDIKDTLANAAPLPYHPPWATQGNLYTLHSVCELFEYYLYLQMLKPVEYRAAKLVERKCGEHFVSVTGRIEAKMIPHVIPYAISLPSEGATAQPQMVAAAVSNTGIQPVPKQHATKGYYKATQEIKEMDIPGRGVSSMRIAKFRPSPRVTHECWERLSRARGCVVAGLGRGVGSRGQNQGNQGGHTRGKSGEAEGGDGEQRIGRLSRSH